jgi:N-acetylgalactosamine-6-sulfatase
MKRLVFCGMFACVFCMAFPASTEPRPAGSRPNIVLFLADDMGLADLACYGATDIRTPRIDRLAHDGVRFARFYSNGPECTPTRAALLTGRYQQRVGGLECAIGLGNVGRYDDAIRLAGRHELGLPATEVTLPRLLKDSGYATAMFGKWHLGYEHKFAPAAHGFDQAFYCIGGGMEYFHHVEDPPAYRRALYLNGAAVRRDGYFTDLVASDAVRWLQNRRSSGAREPFFLYVPFTAPHSPYQGPADRQPAPLPPDSERWRQGKADPRVYAAMIERMDECVGRILDALEELRFTGNTLVAFASDNGGTASARPAGLRGIKGSTFEGGIRVPCIVRWPGVVEAASEYSHPAATFDLTVSMARAAGVTPPNGRPFDGVDILRSVEANAPPPPRTLFWRQRRGERTWRGVRERELKYVSETAGSAYHEYLFDLDADPGEQSNLLAERGGDAARLKAKLAEWEKEVRPVR